MKSRPFGFALACALVLALAVPAFAAAPAKNSHFEAKGNHGQVTPTFDTDKAGKKVVNFSFFNNCAPVPTLTTFKMAINGGKFHFKGTLTDVTKKKISVKIAGKFTSAKVAKGTVNYSTAAKSCPTASFTAKRTGKAQGQAY